MIEWISVANKLPEDGECVLTLQYDGYICEADYVEESFNGDCITQDVTHWIPLPVPPK